MDPELAKGSADRQETEEQETIEKSKQQTFQEDGKDQETIADEEFVSKKRKMSNEETEEDEVGGNFHKKRPRVQQTLNSAELELVAHEQAPPSGSPIGSQVSVLNANDASSVIYPNVNEIDLDEMKKNGEERITVSMSVEDIETFRRFQFLLDEYPWLEFMIGDMMNSSKSK